MKLQSNLTLQFRRQRNQFLSDAPIAVGRDQQFHRALQTRHAFQLGRCGYTPTALNALLAKLDLLRRQFLKFAEEQLLNQR